MQKLFPILVSIAIIIAVALRRDRFRTVAALLVTLPINTLPIRAFRLP